MVAGVAKHIIGTVAQTIKVAKAEKKFISLYSC
jgi:hypothetical protein